MLVFLVPGPVPVKSLQGTSFENKIFLNWKEPLEPNGIITQYEVCKRDAGWQLVTKKRQMGEG
jgi:hypothetical protein